MHLKKETKIQLEIQNLKQFVEKKTISVLICDDVFCLVG